MLAIVVGAVVVAAANPSVRTKWGVVNGLAGSEEHRYLGIPFCEAPIGRLRWQPPDAWNNNYPKGVWDASYFRPVCIQDASMLLLDTNEDCLYLDVFTPTTATPASKLPVMLWIYGGSFTNGAGSQFVYNGTSLAANFDVIVVNINYRVGALGFAAMPGNTPSQLRANFGLQDQREAMRWVQENIGAFGGDSTRVTIFGESAGAISVVLHLLMQQSVGLFHGAISQSGFATALSPGQATTMTSKLANATGCPIDQPAAETCLRTKTSQEILKAQESIGVIALEAFTHTEFSPVVDQVELIEDPKLMVFAKKFAVSVPVLAGSNTNEGWLFVEGDFPLHYVTKTEYEDYIQRIAVASRGYPFNTTAFQLILNTYPSVDGNNFDTAAQLATDLSFACGTTFLLNSWADVTPARPAVYLYHFDHVPYVPIPGIGVYHSSEIPFVFGIPASSPDKPFSLEMGHFWTSFATTGNPNYAGSPATWPAVSQGKQVCDRRCVIDGV